MKSGSYSFHTHLHTQTSVKGKKIFSPICLIKAELNKIYGEKKVYHKFLKQISGYLALVLQTDIKIQ